jgi:hypothetical protein
MKVNELRVGNWVMGDRNIPYQIELSDFSDWYNDHNSHEYGNHLHSIPITEEWLLRFGFTKSFEYAYNVYRRPSFAILGGNRFYCMGIEILSVHQLQNFYFALTKEELELQTTE